MEIRITDNGDIAELKNLWRKVFDEEGIYTDLFFKYRYPKCEGVGLFCGSKILSALYLLPCSFKTNNKEYSAKYIFAVATLPNERGKGYSSEVLSFAHKYMKQNGVDVSILMPAEKSLFDFYKKLGYETAFYVDISKYKVNGVETGGLQKCNLSSMLTLRESYMSASHGYLSWDKDALDFCQIDNDYSHGEVLSFPTICDGYAVCSYFEDCVLIKELVCKDKFREDIINRIGNYFHKKKIILRDKTTEKSTPFGMLYPISEKFCSEYKEGSYFLSLPMD